MSIFYFDSQIEVYEKLFQWDCALNYLENLYRHSKSIIVLNSLIGYSWYYLVEGPLISKKYGNDTNEAALKIWKKYLDIGVQEANADPVFNFIAGYTLSLHGFLLSEEYEKKGPLYMKTCLALAGNCSLRELANNFLINQKTSQYKSLINSNTICKEYFDGASLLDAYFVEIYSC